MSEDKHENWIEKLRDNEEFKSKFIDGLKKLGFPLEFVIRKKLIDKNYGNVKEGMFTIEVNGESVSKSFDISGYIDDKKPILSNLTVIMNMRIIGDCKYSSEKSNFLFAVPDISDPRNKVILCPLLSNFLNANYGFYRNTITLNHFLEKYGDLYFASDIKDSSVKQLMSEKGVPEFEKIFNISEDTILPACLDRFNTWRKFAFNDYKRIFSVQPSEPTHEDIVEALKKEAISSTLIIPVIVTSKPIIVPILNKEMEIIGVEQRDFVLYGHTIKNPKKYSTFGTEADFGIFLCSENGFEKFLTYVENIFSIMFSDLTKNIERHPNRILEELKDMKKEFEGQQATFSQ